MIGAKISKKNEDKEFFVLLNTSKISDMRFENLSRPDSVYIFEVHNSSQVYSAIEIEQLKDCFYSEVIPYLHPVNITVEFQTGKLRNLFKYEE